MRGFGIVGFNDYFCRLTIQIFMDNEFPIEAVITWVDGDDPVHRAKRLSWMNGGREARFDDVAGETRYRQLGEVAFCVASILRFAPFVRKIYIVTDNQNPCLDDFLQKNFPENKVPVEIVDHKVIFRGYEQYLPTFNSSSIESLLWRIPGLSEHYMYFNDDVMLISPVERSDIFCDDGSPVVYGYWHSAVTARLLRRIRMRHNGHRTIRFRDKMLNAADLLGADKFIRIKHTPHHLRRSFFEQYFGEHPDILEKQISYRFRDPSQFNMQCFYYTALALRGECKLITDKKKYIYMEPKEDGSIKKKHLERILADDGALFGCFNSLDKASKENAEMLTGWITARLGISVK